MTLKETQKRCDAVKQDRYERMWQKYFKAIYGDVPYCEICNIELTWDIGNRSCAVNFDHRHGGLEAIKISPSHWWKRRPFTRENLDIWRSCDFGILCQVCNRSVPTLNRAEWVANLVKYVGVS